MGQDHSKSESGSSKERDDLENQLYGAYIRKIHEKITKINKQILLDFTPLVDSDEFKDDDVTIQNIETDGDNFAFIAPDVRVSPFRGGWNYSGDDNILNESKTAFLGVTTESVDGGGVKILSISEQSAAEKSRSGVAAFTPYFSAVSGNTRLR